MHVDHLLSFDVEEYFQVEAAAPRVSPQQWHAWQSRLHIGITQILEILAERQTCATFFILGWVARQNPDLIKKIAGQGHEIASHGMSHTMIHRLSRDEFRHELRDSKKILEEIAGRPVLGYRAPTFSITRRTAWALDVLAEEGFLYDSSIFPVHHDRYGVPDAPPQPHQALGPGGGRLLELPPLTLRLFRTNWPIGGGGYLRLLPIRWIDHALRQAESRHTPGMIYLHPWEFDPQQPRLPMSPLSRWRHRVGLRRTAAKVRWLMNRHRFTPVCRQLESLQAAELHFSYGR